MWMDLDPLYIFYGFAAVAAVLVAEAAYLLLHSTQDYRQNINRRLVIAGKERDQEKVLVQLRRERGLGSEGGFRLPLQALNRLITQSGFVIQPMRIVPMVLGLGIVVFGGVFFLRHEVIEAAGAALVAVTIVPILVLKYLRKRRREAFAGQFPEAIDIIVRSLRAGHPVPVAISMVAREMPDPVGTEFGLASDEITYGSDLETAMRNMMQRVGQEDLPLFVTSVAIQSSTGGNLSQILENLSKVIRDRFKMRRKIKGLSAEGRTSAWILNVTPFVVFAAVNVLSPAFYGDIWNHPITKMVLGGALFWMFVGNVIMRRMINFKI